MSAEIAAALRRELDQHVFARASSMSKSVMIKTLDECASGALPPERTVNRLRATIELFVDARLAKQVEATLLEIAKG